MSRITFDSSEYRKALKSFDGLHCLGCGKELPPLTSRNDRGRIGSILMKCCGANCKEEFLERTLKNWAELRVKIFRRDGYTCRTCGYMAPVKFWYDYIPKNRLKKGQAIASKSIDENYVYVIHGHRQTDMGLEAHHIIPIKEGGPEFDINNCETLCHDCHRVKHGAIANKARAHKTLDKFEGAKC